MFVDAEGRKFQGRISLANFAELRDAGLDLNGDLSKQIDSICSDFSILGKVLWVVYRESFLAAGLTDTSFASIFDGDVVYRAIESLREDIINFSHPSARGALRKLVDKAEQVRTVTINQALTEIDRLDPETIMKSLSESTSSSTAGSSPASSGSTSAEKDTSSTSVSGN